MHMLMNGNPDNCESDVLLTANGICKSFPGVRALNGVNITVRRGRVNALLGENGAGKSTLMNILSGALPADAGDIHLDSRRVDVATPYEAQKLGISTIHQELNLVPDMSVAENIFLGREPTGRLGYIDFSQMYANARVVLARMGFDLVPKIRVSRLPVGVQQVVEIAKAIAFDARVVIMDEPTSALSEQETESLFKVIRQFKQNGVGIIYITHKLGELDHIADDVTIFRDGEFVAERQFGDISQEEMVRLMIGREITATPRSTIQLGAEVLRVSDVSLPHPERPGSYAVDNISFGVRRGEVVGLFGVMGAGRTELLQTIFGLYHGTATGEIYVSGQRVSINSPTEAIRVGITLAPEDRKADGLVLMMNVSENVSLASLKRATTFGVLQPNRERKLVSSLIDRLRVKVSSLKQCVRNLSGGNQQKVVLSKSLATQPVVLLLDEPTRGIDINAKREFYALIEELARDGLGVVMTSSEMPELLAVADRIIVLSEGRVAAEFSREDATKEKLLSAALPVGKLQKAKSV
jgi:ABC-type sugar transport system ATPase subunit